tara:strand:+ start:961 stop:1383 length:423 start_codon:yes stop_codon:yes gene_type:complete
MERETLRIIDELHRSIERIGVEATIKQLKKTDKATPTAIRELVFLLVCEELNISKTEIYSKGGSCAYTRKQSLILISHFLYKYASLSQPEIGNVIGMSKASVNRFLKEVREFNPLIPTERKMLDLIGNIESEIKAFKTKS